MIIFIIKLIAFYPSHNFFRSMHTDQHSQDAVPPIVMEEELMDMESMLMRLKTILVEVIPMNSRIMMKTIIPG